MRRSWASRPYLHCTTTLPRPTRSDSPIFPSFASYNFVHRLASTYPSIHSLFAPHYFRATRNIVTTTTDTNTTEIGMEGQSSGSASSLMEDDVLARLKEKWTKPQCVVQLTVPEGWASLTEGQATVVFQENKKVFYNEPQEANRDLSILMIQMYIDEGR